MKACRECQRQVSEQAIAFPGCSSWWGGRGQMVWRLADLPGLR